MTLAHYMGRKMAGQSEDDLSAFLQERLCARTNLPVFVHILTDYNVKKNTNGEDDDTREYSHLSWKHEQLMRRRLILVFQRHKNSNLLVIGMSVHEYCEKNRHKDSSDDVMATRSYIQYVDTTGLFSPRENQSHLTKSLVCLYIQYCHQQLKCSSLHLMASAKPSFLFAGSEFNEAKGKLSTAKLVKWWFAVIEQACQAMKACKVKVWSPGEDVMEDNRTADRIQRRQAKQSDGIEWSYGPFYQASDRICDVVPLLEDDPKLKHFMSFFEDAHKDVHKMDLIKCKNFMETLGLRPEFRNQCHSTLFMIEFDNRPCTKAVWPEKPSQLAAFATKMLSNLTFEDEGKCVDASGKITSWLKFMGSKPISIKIDALESSNTSSSAKQLDTTDTPPLLANQENAPVNVQGLVKKRKSEVSC